MHYSDDPNKKSPIVTCYCDDSASHEQSRWAILGGALMNKPMFAQFDAEWEKVLEDFRVEAIHMKDFIRPHGKHCTMYPELKMALFTKIAMLINHYKIYSLSIAIPQAEFNALLSKEIYRKFMGPYGLAFLATIAINCEVAGKNSYEERIAYLVDAGPHQDQLLGAHALAIEWEKSKQRRSNIGAIAFDDDENVSALQGADVIGWTSHRKLEGPVFESEFLPLLALFERPKTHYSIYVRGEDIKIFADGINGFIANTGWLPPSMTDFVTLATQVDESSNLLP